MRKMQPLRVDKILIKLLEERANIPFSNTEIRDLYLDQMPGCQRPDHNQLRKHIYRELVRLESVGMIKRYRGSTGRGCKFIYSSESDTRTFRAKHSPFSTMTEQSKPSMEVDTQKALEEELSKRKAELIASIGEAEEYQRLYQKFPALRNSVKTQYLESRERSTKLLGQLRAVETVLTQIGSSA